MWIDVDAFSRPDWQTVAWCPRPVRLLPNLRSQHFENNWTNFDANWYKLSPCQRHELINLGSQEVKSSSHKAKDRFCGLSQVSISTPLGRIGFLLNLYYGDQVDI